MKRRIVALSALACFMLLMIQPVLAQGGAASLVGSWELTLVPSLPPGPPAIEIPGLANFTSDGGAVATGSAILVGTGGLTSTSTLSGPTPAIGNWNAGGPVGDAAFKLVSIITNADGTLFATRTLQALVTPGSGGSSFTGSYSYTIVNTAGTTIASGSGTISGSLIPHFLPPA